jgi:hypothetical protein
MWIIIAWIVFFWFGALYFIYCLLSPIADDIAAIKADTEQIRQEITRQNILRGPGPSVPPPVTPPSYGRDIPTTYFR